MRSTERWALSTHMILPTDPGVIPPAHRGHSLPVRSGRERNPGESERQKHVRVRTSVPEPAAPSASASPPTFPLDALDRLEASCGRLVKLETQSLEEVEGQLTDVHTALQLHRQDIAEGRIMIPKTSYARWRRISMEHEWFEQSFEEFAHLLAVVRKDDHGGNRQALGQYGKLLVEAIRIHLREEHVAEPEPPEGASLSLGPTKR
jgi:hypothetical protein